MALHPGVNQIAVAVAFVVGQPGLIAEINSFRLAETEEFTFFNFQSGPTFNQIQILDIDHISISLGARIQAIFEITKPAARVGVGDTIETQIDLITGRSTFYISGGIQLPGFEDHKKFILTATRGLFESFIFEYPLHSWGLIPAVEPIFQGLNLTISLVTDLQLIATADLEYITSNVKTFNLQWSNFHSKTGTTVITGKDTLVETQLKNINLGIEITTSLQLDLPYILEEPYLSPSLELSISFPSNLGKYIGTTVVQNEETNHKTAAPPHYSPSSNRSFELETVIYIGMALVVLAVVINVDKRPRVRNW